MTPDQARIVLLEDALRQAQSTVQFLHGCLTSTALHVYRYPEHTQRDLDKWAALASKRPLCVHSGPQPGCVACEDRLQRHIEIGEARRILGLEEAS
jgi:hypothetical protein